MTGKRVKIGYHASHEQFPPEELLRWTQAAAEAGFEAVMSADHFHPWSVRQGQSGFAWAWLGAAMQACPLDFGAICVPGGWRYHPAVVAQAAATLARLSDGRLKWIGAGSGEALNERMVGRGWPDKAERNARLEAGVEIIRALWRGETVTRGDPLPVEQARLFCRADAPPAVYAAALTPETAKRVAGWADGLVTTGHAVDDLKAIVEAFRAGGGADKPIVLQMHLSWAEDEGTARQSAWDQWRSNALSPGESETLATPEACDAKAEAVRPDDMDDFVAISADTGRHVAWIEERLELGFDELYLHNVGRNQEAFIERFGRDVLPALRR